VKEGTPAWELSWREHTFAGVGSHAGATSNLASVGPTLASLDPRQREYPYFFTKVRDPSDVPHSISAKGFWKFWLLGNFHVKTFKYYMTVLFWEKIEFKKWM
jgi:hypothetical protein